MTGHIFQRIHYSNYWKRLDGENNAQGGGGRSTRKLEICTQKLHTSRKRGRV